MLVTAALLDDAVGITGVRLTSGGCPTGIAVTISRCVRAVTLPFIEFTGRRGVGHGRRGVRSPEDPESVHLETRRFAHRPAEAD
ncbi:hypothetical protein GCM10010389_13360 [Streptomyces echinoruber]|uniref:Uncharacterized protein n=1 Tax=Streptomyces echinoruber TaxID=68898 RepID=A0A918QYR0_9ACTN|nr:hypothetical protein GCM10010389_13360 [Streptomyces echinoruber]